VCGKEWRYERNFVERSYQDTRIVSDKKIFTRQEEYEVSKDGQSRQIYNKNANTEIFEEKRLKIQDLQ